jgi:hypothetical protein
MAHLLEDMRMRNTVCILVTRNVDSTVRYKPIDVGHASTAPQCLKERWAIRER